MRVSSAGLDLIREFEGLSLEPYKCAAGVWTIGYGHTGPEARADRSITRDRADELLRQDCQSAEQCISSTVTVRLNQNEFDALVSFVFNVGPTAFTNSTLRRLLNDGQPRTTVAAEFDRWVKADGRTLSGLVRRRAAEKALFLTEPKNPLLAHSILANRDTWLKRHPVDSTQLPAEERLFVPKGSAWEWTEIRMYPGEVHHRVTLKQSPDTEWWMFPEHWTVSNEPTPATPAPAPPTSAIRLQVPYYSQRDNRRDPMRTCFSSACAMLLSTLKPGSISGDDEYIDTVFRFGDTTQAWVQVRALQEFGVRAEFRQDGNWSDLDNLLEQGIPVPIGILHHGPVTHPVGSGHWIVVIGRSEDKTRWLVHDPFGDLDLVNGGYLSSNGSGLLYSRRNLGPRWMIPSPGNGWYIRAFK